MAGTTNDFQNNGAAFYLDPNQQDLLLAALASNNQNSADLLAGLDATAANANRSFQYPLDNLDPSTFFASPQQELGANFNANNANNGVEESPFVDYLDGDNFDFDNADDSDLMIGALPGDSPMENESSEKRKSPDDDVDDNEGGGKRREGEDKKKPGRKPLTSEPTTVR